MRGAALVIAGDTGPLHIAAAVGAPIVGLYGPTWPERNGPWDPADEVISALREIGYTGGVHVELSRHSHEAPQAARRAYDFLRPLIREYTYE